MNKTLRYALFCISHLLGALFTAGSIFVLIFGTIWMPMWYTFILTLAMMFGGMYINIESKIMMDRLNREDGTE